MYFWVIYLCGTMKTMATKEFLSKMNPYGMKLKFGLKFCFISLCYLYHEIHIHDSANKKVIPRKSKDISVQSTDNITNYLLSALISISG